MLPQSSHTRHGTWPMNRIVILPSRRPRTGRLEPGPSLAKADRTRDRSLPQTVHFIGTPPMENSRARSVGAVTVT
jgi:hypothetical protein